LQDVGLDTYEANVALGHCEDGRVYAAAAQILRGVKVDWLRLFSNNADKALQLDAYGISIAERIPTGVHLSESNVRYLSAKRDHSDHTVQLP
jgi:GTP cyclohydrolase II